MFQLSIDKERFLKLLLLVLGATAEKKPTMPILANVWMGINRNILTLTGTNTEIEVVVQCELENSTIENREPESITVQAKKLVDICRALPDKSIISLKEQDNKLIIQSGRSRFSLATLPASDFPTVAAIEGKDQHKERLSINTEDLKYLLQSTSFAMTQEDIRTYLNGLLLEKKQDQLITAAMDGHRLASCKIELDSTINKEKTADFRLVLPRKSVLELIKFLDLAGSETVDLMVSDNHFYVDGGHYTFVTNRLNCDYPNYEMFIPKNVDKTIKIERDPFKQMLSRVSILANEKKRGVLFNASGSLLKIFVNNLEQEAGEDEMEMIMEGEPFEASFNINYVMDILNNLPSVEVKISCANPDMGVLFESDVVSQVKYVVMPIKM
jgi:DNA polymerase-3 subunit beta